MGIDFRGKNYVRRIRIGKRTVKEGEAVAIWDQYGRHHQVVGPALCRLWWSTIHFLERHVAEKDEYLRIRDQHGKIEHVRGPSAMFENPVYHRGVTVERAIQLPSSTTHLVVRREPAEGTASTAGPGQEVISGPLTFFPDVTDTVQVFNWADQGGGALSDGGRVVSVGKTISRVIPFQVQGVDSHTAKVNVNLLVRLVGIQEVLAVADPIGECDSVTQAAIRTALQGMSFSSLGGSSLLEKARTATADAKFQASAATELRQRAACELLGIGIHSVQPSEALAKILHEEDELAATKVKNQIADSTLDAASARQEREQALEVAKQKHELRLAAERHEAEMKLHALDSRRHLDGLKELKSLGVDLTQYLCTVPRTQMTIGCSSTSTSKPQGCFCL